MTRLDQAYRSAYRALFFALAALAMGTLLALGMYGVSAARHPLVSAPLAGSITADTVDEREGELVASEVATLTYSLIAARLVALELRQELEATRDALAVCHARAIMGEGGGGN